MQADPNTVGGRRIVDNAGPVIAIVGRPAAGKSHLANRLASTLELPHLDIDQEGEVTTGRWVRLLDRLAAEPGPCIVESCIAPEPYRDIINHRGALVIKVKAPTDAVRLRLIDRGVTGAQLRRMLKTRPECPRSPDLVWNGVTDRGTPRGGRGTFNFDRLVAVLAPQLVRYRRVDLNDLEKGAAHGS